MGLMDWLEAEEAADATEQTTASGKPPNTNGHMHNGVEFKAVRDGKGPFDILDEVADWDDIFVYGANYTRLDRAPDSKTEVAYRRPGAESAYSVKILKANSHVAVVHSDAAGLPTGGNQKLTKGRVCAHLHHGGDHTAAATAMLQGTAAYLPPHVRDALQSTERHDPYEGIYAPQDHGDYKNGHQADAAPEQTADWENEFWAARPALEHVRDFALARMCAPWAVLGVVILRVLHYVPPGVTLPSLIGGPGSLNLFVALVGDSGAGKGTTEAAARDAFDLHIDPVYTAAAGSGEGLTRQYAYWDNKEGLTIERSSVLFTASEVDVLAALDRRQGSTLMPQLRSAFSGEQLGFAYADRTKRIMLPPHSYRLGLVVGVQPGRAEVLLSQADGGTPQRFIWLLSIDPAITADPPREPPQMAINTTRKPWWTGELYVPPEVKQEVREARAARARGESHALDGHALYAREKIAVALALLDERRDMNLDDWQLAGRIMTKSDTVRASVVATLKAKKAREGTARAIEDGRRELIRGQVVEDADVQRACQAIIRKLSREGGWVAGKTARAALASKIRSYFDGAIERLLDAGQIEVEGVEYHGQAGIRLRLKQGAR